MGDGSPIRCRRKGQRLVVDSDGEQIEQSLEVLCQKMNDDRREISVAPLQTSYKLVQETVADGHFRELCRTFGQLCDLVKKSLQKLLLI